MKLTLSFLFIFIFFFGCSKKEKILFDALPHTYLIQSDFHSLPGFSEENYAEVLENFRNNCTTSKAKKLYGSLCEEANGVSSAKEFLENSFTPFVITKDNGEKEGLLTGYYEAKLFASLTPSEEYKYPIYKTPKDLISVELSSIYPELKHYRLRGRIEGNKLVPYDTREESKTKKIDADIICYCNSKVDKFFLEIQGSGRVKLEDNSTLFIGYDNQNGHKYRAIGRYLVKIKAMKLEDVSLQSIRAWLDTHPSRVDEVLNYNHSMVYFKQREQGATGALGVQLTPQRSIAVDRKYIPLGSMVYLHSNIVKKNINKFVFAQDTGGAIKGAVRADLFVGSGKEALEIAGKLKSKLQLWILLPKNMKQRDL